MAHTSTEPWTSSPKRNEVINWVICEKPPWRMKKQDVFETKRLINRKLSNVFEKTTTLLETSWRKNCGNFLICQTRNWRSSFPKSSTYKAHICYQQISIIRPYWLSDQSESGNIFSKNHEAGRFSRDIDVLGRNRSTIILRFILKQF